MRLDLCIPAYNEEAIIEETLHQVVETLQSTLSMPWRIIVSVNGSSDRTAEVSRAFGDKRITVIETLETGKGFAIKDAARMSDSEYFGFIDADLSADPKDIALLLEAILLGANVAIGSRLLNTYIVKRGLLRTFSSKLFNLLRRRILGVSVYDSQCGLKIMDSKGRDELVASREEGWFLDLEFLARCERSKLLVQELPVHWDESFFVHRSSKLRVVRGGIQGVLAMMRIRIRLARTVQ